MSLIDDLRASRRIDIKVGKITFRATRATLEKMLQHNIKSHNDVDVAKEHVDGWDGVTVHDILGDGSTKPVPFDKDLYIETIADKPEWWQEIAREVLKDAQTRLDERRSSEKK